MLRVDQGYEGIARTNTGHHLQIEDVLLYELAQELSADQNGWKYDARSDTFPRDVLTFNTVIYEIDQS